jgi:RNA polymerase sigma factor (sigma-70 family)
MTQVRLPEIHASVIVAAQAGDSPAHAAIYAHYSNRIFTLIYRIIPRRSLAEDLLQEVFIEVLREINQFAGIGSFGGWLRSIAVNKCLMQIRSPWHRSMLWLDDSSIGLTFEQQVPALDIAHALQTDMDAALRRLPPLTRAVVWLHDVEGYTHAEIAQLFGRTTSFSKSQLTRAHLRLREYLAANETSEPLPCPSATQPLSTNS